MMAIFGLIELVRVLRGTWSGFGAMPPADYLILHPEARHSGAEK